MRHTRTEVQKVSSDRPAGKTKHKKRGFPGPYARREPPREQKKTFRESPKGLDRKVQTVECGGVLLSHTLSSAVPSPRPGLSFRVRKGTGRLTWAMTTAKPIQRPTTRIGRQNRNHATIPIVAVREPDNGREQPNASPVSFPRPQETMLLAIQRKKPPQDETRPSKRIGKSVPRSPVSTGRLHPSRGFHLRPIEHVFNMRATNAPGSVKES